MEDHENVEAPTSPTPQAQAASTPSEAIPKEARTFAMLCHLITLAGYVIPFGNIIGPLVLWLIKKDEMPFVDDQGKEALNFQITVTIAAVVLIVLSIVPFAICLTFPVLLAIVVVDLIFVIIGTIKANDGHAYRYPVTIRIIN
jgi:hypothetical protein